MGGTTSDKPLLTAGVTAYNAADTIERAVDSALAQTWEPLEILIVDDASTDETPAILARLADTNPQIRVTTHELNQGTAVARNTLIEHARGEAIAFFDDDDTSHPERIARQWQRLIVYEQTFGSDFPVLCYAGRQQVFPDGSTSQLPGRGSNADGEGPNGPRLVAALLWFRRLPRHHRGSGGTCTQMGRLGTYQHLGGFDARFRRAQDTELEVRLARAGGHVIGVREPLVTQVLSSSADRNVEQQRQASVLLLHKHRDAFPSGAVFVATLRWTEARFALLEGERPTALRHLRRAFLAHPAFTVVRGVQYLIETPRYLSVRRGTKSAFGTRS